MDERPADPVTLRCHDCRGTFGASALRGVTVTQWVADLERQRCPACGAAYRVTSLGAAA